MRRVGIVLGTVALVGIVSLVPVSVNEVSAQQAGAVQVAQGLVTAWNSQSLDASLAAFAPDAKIQGGDVCCAAVGTDQIRPFLQARFAEKYQIGWTNPQAQGNSLMFLSHIVAHDGIAGTSVGGTAGPGDPEASPIQVTVADGKVTLLQLGLSQGALERAKASRAKSG